MLRKFIFVLFFINFYFFFLPKKSFAQCGFKTSNYLTEFEKPNLIREIDINIPNSRKYNLNLIKAFLSSKTSRGAIHNKYKRKFKANINVKYDFGSCNYKGKVWQNGDWKDHLKSDNGNFYRSLNVKLEDGNIMNATKFKLLIPETRNGFNEILATLIFKNLGFISPETFETSVIVNGIKSNMIFQEDSQKELLERNLRREGHIYEGDESLIWSEKQFSLNGGVGGGGLENISLARLINRNWFLKGNISQSIVLNSLFNLQNGYLEYSDQNIEGFNIFPSNVGVDLLENYNFLMLSMNGLHGLRPHNRKFYFNSIDNKFESIYYDGDLDFFSNSKSKNFLDTNETKLFSDNKYLFPYFEEIENPKFLENLKYQYKLRVLKFENKDELFLEKSYLAFLKNAKNIQRLISSMKKDSNKKQFDIKYRDSYLNRNKISKIEKYIIDDFEIEGDEVQLELVSGEKFFINISDFSRLLSRKKYQDKRFLYLPKKNKFMIDYNLKLTKILDTDVQIIYPNTTKVKLIKDNYPKKKLLIYQSSPEEAVLISGGIIDNLEIIFLGSNIESENKISNQRFNKRGLTGCLTIHNSVLNDVSINLSNGKCEDSLNIINSKGNISSLVVKNSFQDALDIDFSSLLINNVEISNAGNDCIDVSGGSYIIENASLIKCKDKGISVGEKSKLNIKSVLIDQSNIGIAVKDFSYFKGLKNNILNAPICIKVFQKKKEFGGAVAKVNNINCSGKYFVDKNSILNI